MPLAVAFGDGKEPAAIRACQGFLPPKRAGTLWELTTDDTGTFCLRADTVPHGGVATVRTRGTRYFAPLEDTFPLRSSRRAVRLAFDAAVMEAALDRPTFVTWVHAEPVGSAGYGTPLRLSVIHEPRGGPKAELSSIEVPIGARARIEVPSEALRPPGLGTLWVEHKGSPTISPARASAVLRRLAAVTLSVPGEAPTAESGGTFPLTVGATSVVGAVPSGWVEAVVDGQAAGAGRVEDGVANVEVSLEAARPPEQTVQLRYVSAEPWWLPSEPTELQVRIARPSLLMALPWLIAVVTIAIWVMRTWRRPGRGARRRDDVGAPRGRAEIELVEAGPADAGWAGLVVDAHEGTPIAGATLQILVPTFDGEGLVATAVSDARGGFSLPPDEALAGGQAARLRASGRHHASLVRRLPKPGRVVVSLTSRRRAVLERLVIWAQISGKPWARSPEPTPAEVARTAAKRGEPSIESWARAVEEAAYGAAPPDEPREREVLAREPRMDRHRDDR
jgi:hypothetical protein